MARTTFGATTRSGSGTARYEEDDWADMRQDTDSGEWPAVTATPPQGRQQPSSPHQDTASKPQAPQKPPQDRTPHSGHQHYLIRNIPKHTIARLIALAKANHRSLNQQIIAILDAYTAAE